MMSGKGMPNDRPKSSYLSRWYENAGSEVNADTTSPVELSVMVLVVGVQ